MDKIMYIQNSIYYSNGYSIGIYYSPSDGVVTGRPWCIRILNGDVDPYRHGIMIVDWFETKELADSARTEIAKYLNLKIEEFDL